eukprot:TRINITY_DN3104_c0_g3_i1.p1 TRINITY_DN3104_c0_g3~~TRINITY_DN3104_c0_g3_i1.p1  ORF type:complete len:276 (-),score=68.17 TRINITY_DN3104_c0_g3_i1:258-1085(-)
MAEVAKTKKWGDTADEEVTVVDKLPEDYVEGPDANGIKTYYHFEKDAEGKTVKTTRRVKVVSKKFTVSPAVHERMKWSKFGTAAANTPAAENSVTYFGEEVILEIKPQAKAEPVQTQNANEGLISITCRICGAVGLHYTHKCPFMNKMEGAANTLASASAAVDANKGGSNKYVPPSARRQDGASKPGDSPYGDTYALRVTNLSPDAMESDVRELFGKFGQITKCIVSKNANQQSRGIAYVHFIYREEAEKAREALKGYGYDHLILDVDWAKPLNR